MGKHYVPQHLLKGFEDPAKVAWIWMYDKREVTCKQLPIKQVAQTADFYNPTDEKNLNLLVERPANPVLDKLRSHIFITTPEQKCLALYIANMVYRVPNFRAMARDMAPQALDKTASKVRTIFKELEAEGKLDPATAAKTMAQIDSWEAKYSIQLPPEAEDAINNPWPSWASHTAILKMHWRVGCTSGPSFFLISDNPAYYLSQFGLTKPEAELILPISSTVAIHVSNRPLKQHGFRQFDQNVVDEFNRRIANGATRFIFYHEQQSWVLKIAQITQHLNRINWNE